MSDEVMIWLKIVPPSATATKRLLPYVTLCQLLSAALAWLVHRTPLLEVWTRLPEPLEATATKVLLPQVTDLHEFSAALVRLTHVRPPSEDVCTSLGKLSTVTVTKRPLPYATPYLWVVRENVLRWGT